ncbi:hypothetical protein C8J57DRAFT_1501890 [Mycena rebaudengoi]|nr:hypothetical protein C8J57DRAFT_1501890 [Mycena rebaudengoi]
MSNLLKNSLKGLHICIGDVVDKETVGLLAYTLISLSTASQKSFSAHNAHIILGPADKHQTNKWPVEGSDNHVQNILNAEVVEKASCLGTVFQSRMSLTTSHIVINTNMRDNDCRLQLAFSLTSIQDIQLIYAHKFLEVDSGPLQTYELDGKEWNEMQMPPGALSTQQLINKLSHIPHARGSGRFSQDKLQHQLYDTLSHHKLMEDEALKGGFEICADTH